MPVPMQSNKGTPLYKSTRGGQAGLSFEEAVFEGLAKDGGLLIPEWVPDVSGEFKKWASLPFDELAFEVVSRYCSPKDIPSGDLRALLKRSYQTFDHPEVVPCRKVGDIHIMELFHGPSLSFKDVALQGLGNLYEYFLKRNPRRLTILAATSGDTGSAAIHGLAGKENVDCFVLFPEGRVSAVQQLQMTSVLDPNVHCLSLTGTFDDCQNIVKELMGDLQFKSKFGIGAVNSINWARIMLQITYYFYTYFKLFPQCDGLASFSVPTGNFGDILAGYYAKRMGLPIKNLVVATNANDILHRFFTLGQYDKEAVRQTSSPSMDIGISSNFERYLFYLFDEDSEKLSSAMSDFKNTGRLHVSSALRERACIDFLSAATSEDLGAEAAKTYLETHGYDGICPHTSCGVSAVEQLRTSMKWQFGGDHQMVVLGTAHPAKFPDAVKKATGKLPTEPLSLQKMQGAETRCQTLSADSQAVRAAVENNTLAAVVMDLDESLARKRKHSDSVGVSTD